MGSTFTLWQQDFRRQADAMDCDLIEDLARALQGIPFRQQAIRDQVAGMAVGERESMVQDLLAWLQAACLA